MIIYPQGFVLSAEAAGASLVFPRIAYQSFTFDLTDSDVTASGATADGPKDSPLRSDTAEYWEPPSLPGTWVLNLGATRSLDYVGIAGHTIGSAGASATVETSMGDFIGSPETQVWTALGGEVSPSDDAPLLFLDDARNARFMRITVDGTATLPRIAVAYTGIALVMEREEIGSGFQPANLSRETMLNANLSRGGQFLGQSFRRMGVTNSATFQLLDPEWYRANFDPFVKHARSLPYFFAWWPAKYTEEIAYVWTQEDIRPTYMGVDDFMQVSWKMNGIGNL